MRIAAALLLLALFGVGSILGPEKPNILTREERNEGCVLLFNGKNLEGWEGDPKLWSVKNSAIVGSSDGHPIQQNTFLIHKKHYSDFVLKVEVRLRNGNSGIQFRSTVLPSPGWVVSGYQADLSDTEDRSALGQFL